MAAYSSLLAQTVLLFQRKTGHRVSYYSVQVSVEQNRCVALVEYEHADVGMTAVKLASELVSGRRRMLAEPFRIFDKFATERLLPYQTEAIIKAARQRDIPAIHLERQPYRREDFEELTGGDCICPNGLLMLGHGKHQTVLDGTWSLDLQQDLAGDMEDPEEVAEQILERLFPDQVPARMPIVAITGTNGKTTTTRMIHHIMQHAGKKSGMVCTDGIFIDGQQLVDADKSARGGHLRVLTSKQADIAVLETHHAGILSYGFALKQQDCLCRWCDIAVCLNVSEDHLGVGNIDTVEQMAELKRALPERARYAAVLNADDEYCLDMIDALNAQKLCLVSMESGVDELQNHVDGHHVCFCVLEPVDKSDWLVIHDDRERLPVMAVEQIPATFGGTARFNTSNAMHAVVASHLAGVGLNVIREAMASFTSDYGNTPGRLNVFDQLPFRIVMDFAHNPDGMHRLCEFTDQQDVTGRKVIAFSGPANRRDDSIRNMGRSIAGHFDFYICKEYVHSTEQNHRKVAHLLKEGLLDAGVDERQIMVTSNGKEVIFEIFDTCKPGDLLIMLMGYVEQHQLGGYVQEYAQAICRSR